MILIVAGLGGSACTHKTEMPAQSKPAKTEAVQGTELSRVTLSPKAAERLDIKTAAMRDEQVKARKSSPAGAGAAKPTAAGAGAKERVDVAMSSTRKVVPTSAVLYDAKGKTWVYTNPEPLVFVRHAVSIDYIDGDRAVLLDGPASGTAVVTVGAAELLGTEYGRK
ncbi:MAG: hypothetical protein AUG80_11030 [Candidatus Rokubacteria bacterium 13_1_20CM_4_68_9]|nr:MAG: hypothetical protein AUH76_08940 [Candidatus Rokubacteria bacterium 13_1_40CM_4_67_11]OLD97589.1 MAG: hypothetical protein AUG80_11030 [Candidatus Rokubacteria bacterium 13_1_20CM_4_68_9]PYN59754.1 MAG: hypothetical protein DMD90_28350 [Candidatus Rokubacteria bacterium]